MAERGQWVHGEADLVCWFEPRTVLDAGCGTGRVAAELHRRGIHVVGVDLDPRMLEEARRKAPRVCWLLGDLAEVDAVAELPASAVVDGAFELAVMAGNVMLFVDAGSEARVVANMARHLRPGGRLVAGFQLMPGRLTLTDYDGFAEDAGLVLEHRWATWEREPYLGGDYAVSAHRA